jgi:hypothetical protein
VRIPVRQTEVPDIAVNLNRTLRLGDWVHDLKKKQKDRWHFYCEAIDGLSRIVRESDREAGEPAPDQVAPYLRELLKKELLLTRYIEHNQRHINDEVREAAAWQILLLYAHEVENGSWTPQ